MLGIGNCGEYAGEFNFYGDSESAKIVLDKYSQQCPVSVVTWEATRLNLFPTSTLSQPDSVNAAGRLLHQIHQHAIKNYCEKDKDGNPIEEQSSNQYHQFPNTGLAICDLIAAIYCLYPETATIVERFPCTVELDGKYTRSMMVVDRQRTILPNNNEIDLPVRFDMDKIFKLPEMNF